MRRRDGDIPGSLPRCQASSIVVRDEPSLVQLVDGGDLQREDSTVPSPSSRCHLIQDADVEVVMWGSTRWTE